MPSRVIRPARGVVGHPDQAQREKGTSLSGRTAACGKGPTGQRRQEARHCVERSSTAYTHGYLSSLSRPLLGDVGLKFHPMRWSRGAMRACAGPVASEANEALCVHWANTIGVFCFCYLIFRVEIT